MQLISHNLHYLAGRRSGLKVAFFKASRLSLRPLPGLLSLFPENQTLGQRHRPMRFLIIIYVRYRFRPGSTCFIPTDY